MTPLKPGRKGPSLLLDRQGSFAVGRCSVHRGPGDSRAGPGVPNHGLLYGHGQEHRLQEDSSHDFLAPLFTH